MLSHPASQTSTSSQPRLLSRETTHIRELTEQELRRIQRSYRLPVIPTRKQGLLLIHPARRSSQPILWGGALGGGKMQPISSHLCTPFGFIRMGDIKVGTRVSNPDGCSSRVIAVWKHGEQDVYRVTFGDGTYALCGIDHLWLGRRSGRHYKKYGKRCNKGDEGNEKIFTTAELKVMTDRANERRNPMGNNGHVLIPVTAPVRFERNNSFAQRYIDPYLLGVLLGDGYIEQPIQSITSADPEIIDRMRERADLSPYRSGQKANNAATSYYYNDPDLTYGLVKLKLRGVRSWEKFVPEQYKYAPLEDRLELLRGLMDTDGTASTDGKAYYCTTSPRLADDVRWLVESLGGVATISETTKYYTLNGEKHPGRLAYVLYIKLPDPSQAFTLARKKERCGIPQGLYRKVVSVEFEKREECWCITVDNANGLYLTDDFIVTHNSAGGALWGIKWGEIIPENRILLCRGTFADFMRSTYQELEKFLTMPGMEHWKIWPGKHEAHNTRNGSEIWWTGVGSSTKRSGETEGHKLGSTQFGAIFIDEAPDIPRSVFIELGDRLRHPAASQVNGLQYALTANPYPSWVKEDFIVARKPGYHFIKATMADNPHVYREYASDVAAHHTPEEVRALVYGDWDALGPTDQAIPSHLLIAMTRRTEQPDLLDTVWGIDVSRRGNDWTTVWQRSGYRFERIDAWQGLRGTQSADRVADLYARAPFKPRRINVDTNGLGADVTDPLVRLSALGMLGECVVDEVFGGRAASDPLHYVNLNAELTGKLESLARSGRGQIVPDPEQKVLGDLGILKYTWQQGRKKVQNNEEIRAQLGRSPDDGNALVYTLYEGREDYVPDFDGTDDDPDSLDGLGEDDRMRVLLRRESKRKADTLMTNFYTGLGLDVGDLYANLGDQDELPY